MTDHKQFDVIIIGGSYSGLAAGMALGRALLQVLIIDSGRPCNAQTPHAHNFLTQDGKAPSAIASIGKQQAGMYKTVAFFNGLATNGRKTNKGFEIDVESGKTFIASKLIFATGINDILPDVYGVSACWGISVLHCPYCHGYEVRNEKTGILENGEHGFGLAGLISNWTNDLTIFTNGTSTLTPKQRRKLEENHIKIEEKAIDRLEHNNGYVENIIFYDGTKAAVKAIYSRNAFIQHSHIPETLGCELTDDGYIKVNPSQETTVYDIYACGDNTSRIRTIANSVAMGATAGMMSSKKLISEKF